MKRTNKPMAGIPIKVIYSWHANSEYHYRHDTTDAKGEYKIDLKKERGYSYDIQAKNQVDNDYESIDYKKSAINFSLSRKHFCGSMQRKPRILVTTFLSGLMIEALPRLLTVAYTRKY